MNILYFYADNPQEWNCSEWRCRVPLHAINQTKRHEARMLYVEEWGSERGRELSEWADVIVVQRLIIGRAIAAVEFWKSKGKIVVGDVDDAYHLMTKKNIAYRFWKEGIANSPRGELKLKYPPLEQLEWGVKLLDGLTTPSKVLIEDWQKYTHKVYWLPNFFALDHYLVMKERPRHDGLIIGWGGSASHFESWNDSGLLLALSRVFQKRRDVMLSITSADTRLLKLPGTIIPPDRYTAYTWKPLVAWADTLSSFDIGLIPLSGPYDQRRSPIKAMEYGVFRTPWIGSDSKALEDFKDCGILVKNSPKEWEWALLEVIDSLGDYRKMADLQWDYVMRWEINANVERIVDTYERIGRHE